ncbi:hypothetical protein [Asaia platycodi]|uniref:hypothetical protein n=1 Tax=Asaia platycodi TaxID=610243 RepID=UPI000472F420|nr:hypothetical protein [Asaia platycodi]
MFLIGELRFLIVKVFTARLVLRREALSKIELRIRIGSHGGAGLGVVGIPVRICSGGEGLTLRLLGTKAA